ncbi:MAG: leucyl aminopeptidase family protein [Actinobacteria bacterium]|nr:leucyl aminopeptidase family protein [Actinomycetota bacterium]
MGYRKDSKKINFLLSKNEISEIERSLSIGIGELFDLHSKEARGSNESVDAKAGELFIAPLAKGPSIAFYSIGSASVPDLRKAGSSLGRRFKGKDQRVHLIGRLENAFIEALILSNYSWSEKSAPAPTNPRFTFDDGAINQKEFDSTMVIIASLWRARDLIHTTSNIKSPAWVAQEVKKMAKGIAQLKVEVRAGRELAEFGGLRAVGGSSTVHPPRLAQMSYTPRGAKRHVVLVGKGITFDTGGVSLKRPYEMMVAMKTDMSGAAVVSAVTIAAAKLKIPVKVTALLMLAENTISATAQRPSDVIKHYGGTTVEVINTDAEGRLVLADGLAFADLHLDPDFLIDVATLTGAASLGLGKQYAAMYTRDNRLAKNLHEISLWAGDPLWQMPLIDDYAIALKSEVADFNHTADKPKFGAGSVTAALFLEKFVGKRKWVHLDIAGPARSEVDAGEFVKGGTGFGVRTLTRWLATL